MEGDYNHCTPGGGSWQGYMQRRQKHKQQAISEAHAWVQQ
jgi:hypothetical protein